MPTLSDIARKGGAMPYTPKQNRLFQAAAHNPAIAKQRGIPQGTAKKLAAEGVKAPAGKARKGK
jgi:hypothetical protein